MLGECLDIEADEIGDEQDEAADLSVKWRGAREKARTSATASVVGPTTAGRSSSRRRDSGAKPSALSTSRTAVALSGAPGLLERGADVVDRVVALPEGDDAGLGTAA
jgi:hypothetical protein